MNEKQKKKNLDCGSCLYKPSSFSCHTTSSKFTYNIYLGKKTKGEMKKKEGTSASSSF